MRSDDASRLQALPRVLTIAGSDSGGGAGIQADIKVITCLGGYAMSAVTALTAQNTRGVWGIHPVPPAFVARQIELCLADIGANAAKIGMLCNAAIVHSVACALRKRPVPQLVVDPVLISKSGHRLLDVCAESALVREILPLADVVTPNLHEASRLAGVRIRTRSDMRRAAQKILALGPRAVLIKGGHLRGPAADLLYDGKKFLVLESRRIATRNTHGTGCSFSAALAVELARGLPLPEAAARAKRFIALALLRSVPLGTGCGPTNPLAAAQELDSARRLICIRPVRSVRADAPA